MKRANPLNGAVKTLKKFWKASLHRLFPLSRIRFSASSNFEEIAHVAIGANKEVRRKRVTYHTGIIYRRDNDGEMRLFHQCGHKYTIDEEPTAKEMYLWSEPNLIRSRAEAIAGYASLVAERAKFKAIPYGFSDPQNFLDRMGRPIDNPSNVGVTCAGLILAIFHVCKKPLVQYETWEIREEDMQWQMSYAAGFIRRHPEETEHHRRMISQIGKIPRYTPLQVVGASMEPNPPVDFKKSERNSGKLKKLFPGI